MIRDETPLFNEAFNNWYNLGKIDPIEWQNAIDNEFNSLQNNQKVVAIAWLCSKYEASKNYAELKKMADMGIELAANYEPGDPLSYYEAMLFASLGVYYFHFQEYEEAIKYYSTAISIDPSSTAWYSIEIVEINFAKKDYVEAALFLDHAVSIMSEKYEQMDLGFFTKVGGLYFRCLEYLVNERKKAENDEFVKTLELFWDVWKKKDSKNSMHKKIKKLIKKYSKL